MMQASRADNLQRIGIWVYIAFVLAIFGVLVYSVFTAPVAPYYVGEYPFVVNSLLRPEDAGELQQGDVVTTLNSYPIMGCRYLFGDTPLYDAPRGKPLPVTYQRLVDGEWQKRETSIILRDRLPKHFSYPITMTIVAGGFLLVGASILLGKHVDLTRFLLGSSGMLASLIVFSGGTGGGYAVPWYGVIQFGLPLFTVLAIVVHSNWPIRQMNRWVNRGLLLVSVIVCVVKLALVLKATPLFGCTNIPLLDLEKQVGVVLGAVIFANHIVPLWVAHRSARSPLVETQTRVLLWSIGIGLGIPVFFSMIPQLLRSPIWIPQIFAMGITGVIPVTYAYVAHQSALIRIESYLDKRLFGLLVMVSWLAATFMVLAVARLWIPDPGTLTLAVVSMIPAILFLNIRRSPLRKMMETAVYGKYYDYEELIARLTQSLSGVPTLQQLVAGVTEVLSASLSVESTALWLLDVQRGALVLCETSSWNGVLSHTLPEELREAELEAIPHSRSGVILLFHELYELGGHGWRVGVKLEGPNGLEGLLLLGAKVQNRPYSEKDTRVIGTMTGWVANQLYTRRVMDERAQEEHRIMSLLLRHEEALRRKTAADLHDGVITPLGWVKSLVAKGQSSEVIQAALQSVLDDLRKLSRSQLSPFSGNRGLAVEVENLVLEYRSNGVPISFELSDSTHKDWAELDDEIQFNLFYAVREAIENAMKADESARIYVGLEMEDGEYGIKVVDEGPGFDIAIANKVERQHRGLSVMKARLHRINGGVHLSSEIGTGTTIEFRGPKRRPAWTTVN